MTAGEGRERSEHTRTQQDDRQDHDQQLDERARGHLERSPRRGSTT